MGWVPGVSFDDDFSVGTENTGNVVVEASASEVRHGVEAWVFEQGVDRVEIASVRGEQGVGDGLTGFFDDVSNAESTDFEESSTSEGESVGVESV